LTTEPLEDAPGPREYWQAGWAALPLLALCAVGWAGMLAPLPLASAVVLPFMARRSPETAPFAPWVAVFAALTAFLPVLGGPRHFLEGFNPFFLGLLLAYLCGAALDGVTQGSLWAWLAPLLIFLVNPSPAGLLGGLGLAAFGAERSRGSRAGGHARVISHRAVALLGAAGLVIFLLAIPLGRPAFPPGGPLLQPTASTAPASGPTAERASETRGRARTGERVATRPVEIGDRTLIVINLAAVASAFVVLIAYLVVRRGRAEEDARRRRWGELLPIVAGAVLAIVLLAWGASAYLDGGSSLAGPPGQSTAQGAADGSAAGAARTEPAAPLKVDLPIWMLLVAAFASLFAIAGGVVFLYHFLRMKQEEAPDDDGAPSANDSARHRAASRVRAAYAAFLADAAAAGQARDEAETPHEFALRFAVAVPQAAADAGTLTRLYEPVRYGELADEGGAVAAEEAVAGVRAALAMMAKRMSEEN
jgi:hypothetical protein